MPLPLLALVPAALAGALDAACPGLDADARARAEALAASIPLYDCCDRTVAECLGESPPCRVATRVAREICRRVAAGEGDDAVRRAIELRARSMLPGGEVARVATEGWPSVGPPDAPVTVVVYICLRCPFCARLEPELVRAFEEGGPLAGRARLVVKLFPLKTHPGSTRVALGALAAHEQGRFFDYVRLAYEEFNRYDDDMPAEWARRIRLDMEAWTAAFESEATRRRLVESKREGIAVGVDATPTLLVDGRRFRSRPDLEQIVDMVEEAADRAEGRER